MSIDRRIFVLPAIVTVATVIVVNAVAGQDGKHPAPIGNKGQHQRITKSKTPIFKTKILKRKSKAPKTIAIAPRNKPVANSSRAKGDGIGQLLRATARKKKSETVTRTSLLVNKKIRFVQTRLAQLGFEPGPVDGVLGQKTRDAIKKFENARKIPVTGEISRTLIEALSRSASFASLAIT